MPGYNKNYAVVRAQAQAEANKDGYDRGLEYNELMNYYRFFLLPGRRHRFGHESRCEVVSCEDYEKQAHGHGQKPYLCITCGKPVPRGREKPGDCEFSHMRTHSAPEAS
jgi:hypothetical protein